jgi:hypothetical protein
MKDWLDELDAAERRYPAPELVSPNPPDNFLCMLRNHARELIDCAKFKRDVERISAITAIDITLQDIASVMGAPRTLERVRWQDAKRPPQDDREILTWNGKRAQTGFYNHGLCCFVERLPGGWLEIVGVTHWAEQLRGPS